MIASTFAREHDLPVLLAVAEAPPRGGACAERSSFLRQLAVLPEMVATLDTLTTAGQHHTIGKILAFIEDHIGRACRGLSARNQRTFLELLEHLTAETKRIVPDIRAFSSRTESLVALLAAIV